MNNNYDELTKIDALDFRNNNIQLLLSYVLRIIGVLVFGLLFILWIALIKPGASMNLKTVLNIRIAHLPPAVSILLIIIDVLFVLYFHELVHASIFYITHRQPPKIGMRGFIIFAAAPSHLLKRQQLLMNALAPFFFISLLGCFALVLVPDHLIAWIIVPAVVNAAASGGDFMAVAWAMKHGKQVLYRDDGDIITAFLK